MAYACLFASRCSVPPRSRWALSRQGARQKVANASASPGCRPSPTTTLQPVFMMVSSPLSQGRLHPTAEPSRRSSCPAAGSHAASFVLLLRTASGPPVWCCASSALCPVAPLCWGRSGAAVLCAPCRHRGHLEPAHQVPTAACVPARRLPQALPFPELPSPRPCCAEHRVVQSQQVRAGKLVLGASAS